MKEDMEALMKALAPLLDPARAKARVRPKSEPEPGMVEIPGDKMDQFLDSLSNLEYSEAMAMICLGASLIYRDSLEEHLSVLEFVDTVDLHIKEFINNPPPQFKSPKLKKEERLLDQDDCSCLHCVIRRSLQAKAAERETKGRFSNVSDPNVEDAGKPQIESSTDHVVVDNKGSIFVASTEK